MAVDAPAVFYYDFNSPYAYLAAERIGELIPDAEWRPIAFAIVLAKLGRLDRRLAELDPAPIAAEIAERATDRGLPPFAPPAAWPVETWSLVPLRAALVADERGRLHEFSRTAFRKSFVESRSLAELDNVLAAAREAGLEPDEVREGVERPEIKERLKGNTEEALARGLTGIPTVAVGEELFWGDDHLEQAAAAARGEAESGTMSEEAMVRESVGALRRAYGEWARGDFSRRELFDPDIEGVWAAELPDPHVDRGVEAFFASSREWLSAWEGFRLEAEAFLPAEDKVVVLVVLRGRGRGSGVEVATPAAHVWTMRLGKAVRVEAYMDRARALEAAGLSES